MEFLACQRTEGKAFMLDIREDLLTDKLIHIEDTKIRQVKHDWLHSDYAGDATLTNVTEKAAEWLLSSKRNSVYGIENFPKLDVIYGCTDYIDNFLMKEKKYQIIKNDYSYYKLLGKTENSVGELEENVPVIVSLPNWYHGNNRPDWKDFLKECETKNINIHLDAAWYTASNGMQLDVSHPNIKTVGFSLTKTGFQWNKFGIRFSRQKTIDSITVRNASGWVNLNTINCANFVMDNIHIDHAWDNHEDHYKQICHELDLEQADFIHVAKKNGKPIGVANILNRI
jgi:hypothetical protein